MNYNYIILNLLILHYIILSYYIILHCIKLYLTFVLLLIYSLFKGNNDKVKFEMSRLRQLDNSRRKVCGRG